MDYLPIIRYELDRLDTALAHIESAARRIPDNRLEERPVPGAMGAGELIDHLLRGIQMTIRAVARGTFTESDLAELPPADMTMASPKALSEYVREVRAEVRDMITALSEEMLDRETVWYFGIRASGHEACSLAYQEALHHRGQIMTYMRLMGVEPVDVCR